MRVNRLTCIVFATGGLMKLDDYLWENRMRQTEFADLIGYTRNYVSMIVTGKVIPAKRAMKLICSVTDGKVTPEDIIANKKPDKTKSPTINEG